MSPTQRACLLIFLMVYFSTASHFTLGASPHIQALVAPINKDTLTSLYTLSLNSHDPFVLDLTGPLLWSPCPTIHPTIPCSTTTCSIARSFPSHRCPPPTTTKRPCTCAAFPTNPATGKCAIADLTLVHITLNATTNGKNPTSPITAGRHLISSCAPRSLLGSLPNGAAGVAGLASSELALPSQLSMSLSLKPQFAICLPSTSKTPGVAFFGDKPFHLLPRTSFDITSILSYTPLVKNPMSHWRDPAYHIDLKGIAVNGVAVHFLARMLQFDSLGNGGVKLSTAVPYTTLRSHIYRPFLQSFANATRRFRRAPRVKPFGLCLKSSALGWTRVGYAVPAIDLMLAGGRNWTVFGANSMIQVSQDTACLAFVDGGPKAEQAVVIGGFQMENNFLLFDLERDRLGFSSSLFFIRTTCGNFNFTSEV